MSEKIKSLSTKCVKPSKKEFSIPENLRSDFLLYQIKHSTDVRGDRIPILSSF